MTTQQQQDTSFIQEVNTWFRSLPQAQQQFIVAHISQGYVPILEWLDKHQPDVKGAMDKFQDYVTDELKVTSEEIVRTNLAELGITEQALIDVMIQAAHDELIDYRDAAFLRNTETQEFERIVSLIITDVFVERRYTSLTGRTKHVGLDRQATRTCYQVILNLIRRFYDMNFTLEILEFFMKKELGFEDGHIESFCNLFLQQKDVLDRYFLFQKLSKVLESFEEVAVAMK